MTKNIVPLLILLVTTSSLLCLTPESKATSTAKISVEPQVITGLDVGDTFTVNITVTDVTDLYGWQIPIYYKSSILNATKASPAPLWDIPGYSWYWLVNFTDNYNETHGIIVIAGFLLGEAKGLNGTVPLATVTFKALAYGNTLLYIDPIGEPPEYTTRSKLIDSTRPFAKEISHTVVNGRAHVGLVDVAIVNMQASLNVPKGKLTLVNVTVENQGIVSQTFDVTVFLGETLIGTQTVVNLDASENRTYTFPLDTNLMSIGEYRLTAIATLVPSEVDMEDNIYDAGLIYIGKRDIAITNIKLSKTCTNDTTVYINVTVTNNGEAPTQQFNVTAYYNTRPIETKTVVELPPGATTILTYVLDTSKPLISKGVYNISATANPIPGETETADNTFTDGSITETIRGDVNGDFKVDESDIYEFAKAFATTPRHLRWNPNCDLNNDEKIDIEDVHYAAPNYGKSI